MCYTFSFLRGKKGNNNQRSFLRRWHYCLQISLDRKGRSTLKSPDIEDVSNFSHNNENKLKEMGKKLLAEAATQAHYGAQMKNLSDKLLAKSFIISVGDIFPIPANFLTQASDLFEINKTFRGSILVVLLEFLV